MPAGRAVLLLRRLSTGDNRFKTLNFGQNTKEQFVSNPVCHHKDLIIPKRLSTFSQNKAKVLARSYSDNTIKMSVSNTDNKQSTEHKHTNRLINEKSPYLLQHAHNPVDWYPWCQEAIDRANQENKVIFLSVGYSTCHWCHVMEKESFENEEVAKIMNENFINIKVDREERPDIDRVYMLFITASSGSGGWPMSVFITPDLKPITGGTYFPPEDNWGRPGFKSILRNLANKWKENQIEWLQACNKTIDALKHISAVEPDSTNSMPGELVWNNTVQGFYAYYEPEFGGFGLAPKFPQASILNFLFHYYARDKTSPEGRRCLEMCLRTLNKIASGGIHDHISGGFARYAVDNDWHVPHFEKMLYDQAQLVVAYTDAYLATKDDFFADIVKDIIKYVKRDLRHESGGFYSAEDADSYPTFGAAYKTEGAFYAWEYDEIKSLLEGKTINSISYLDIFCHYFCVKEDGNTSPENDPHGELKRKNVLITYGTKMDTSFKFKLTLEECDRVLSECTNILHTARQARPRPHLDTKMLCSWNGLMLSGLAQAGQGLGEKTFVEDAIKTAQFIKEHLYVPETQTLLRSCYKSDDGDIIQQDNKINGFLDDYAFLIRGLLDLYEASLDEEWLNWARDLQAKQNELFWEPVNGGYFTSSEDQNIILRIKEDRDGAEPSGNSVSCHNLQRLAAYADKSSAPAGGEAEREMAKKLLMAFSKKLKEVPTALPEMVSALMFYHDSPTQVVISGGRSDPRTLELVRAVRSRLLPGRVLAVTEPDAAAAYNRLRSSNDVPSAYVCRRYACSLPVTDVKQLENLLDEPPVPKQANRSE